MKGLFEASRNFAETMRSWGDAMVLPILCFGVIAITAIVVCSHIHAKVIRSRYFKEFKERRKQS